jgi:hypothetical protein
MIISVNRTTSVIPYYTSLDQSFPGDTAGLAQNNTSDRQETAHRLYSIIKHQHTIIQAIIHEAKQGDIIKIVHQQYPNSIKSL